MNFSDFIFPWTARHNNRKRKGIYAKDPWHRAPSAVLRVNINNSRGLLCKMKRRRGIGRPESSDHDRSDEIRTLRYIYVATRPGHHIWYQRMRDAHALIRSQPCTHDPTAKFKLDEEVGYLLISAAQRAINGPGLFFPTPLHTAVVSPERQRSSPETMIPVPRALNYGPHNNTGSPVSSEVSTLPHNTGFLRPRAKPRRAAVDEDCEQRWAIPPARMNPPTPHPMRLDIRNNGFTREDSPLYMAEAETHSGDETHRRRQGMFNGEKLVPHDGHAWRMHGFPGSSTRPQGPKTTSPNGTRRERREAPAADPTTPPAW
jgi:hypothetical protein